MGREKHWEFESQWFNALWVHAGRRSASVLVRTDVFDSWTKRAPVLTITELDPVLAATVGGVANPHNRQCSVQKDNVHWNKGRHAKRGATQDTSFARL